MTRVAIVEDNTGVRTSLVQIIEAEPGFHCVKACASGEEAVRAIPGAEADVVLMDIKMPGMTGIECTRQLKRLQPDLPVLILTVYNESDLIFEALRAGAGGFLLKRAATVELVQGIKDVLEGGAPMTAHVARRVVDVFRQPSGQAKDLEDLTDRERIILDHLAKGFANKEIAEQMKISVPTVRTHLRNIYAKLHVRSRTQAVLKYRPRQ